MKQCRIIIASITGTSAMTLTSYLLSWFLHRNFKEPKILSQLLIRLFSSLDKIHARITGWCIHYAVGLLFAELYAPIWQHTPVKRNIRNGLILGGITGLAAILVWKFTLDMHPDPPSIKFPGFAVQLFVVHLIFGMFTTIGYNLLT